MGRQVNFYMLPDDEEAFARFVLGRRDARLLAPRSHKNKPLTLRELPAADTELVWRCQVLLARAGYPVHMRRIVMQAGPLAGQRVCFVETAESSVVEFSRSILRTTDCILTRGRLWAEMRRLEGDRLVHKGAEFEAWYDSLAAWIRKHFRRLPAAPHFNYYLGPQAYDWRQVGGELQDAPPAAPETLRTGASEGGDGMATQACLELCAAGEGAPQGVAITVTLADGRRQRVATARTDPQALAAFADGLTSLATTLCGEAVLEAGHDEADYLRLRLYALDRFGHLACRLRLPTRHLLGYAAAPPIEIGVRTGPAALDAFLPPLRRLIANRAGSAALKVEPACR